MELESVLDALGYKESPNYLRAGTTEFATAPNYGHIFRRAATGAPQLRGVYALRSDHASSDSPIVPLVYVCQAHSRTEADRVHRLVWNQDIVPFLIVLTPTTINLYSGFRYEPNSSGHNNGLLRSLDFIDDIAKHLKEFSAASIDNASLWSKWGAKVAPENRVDWKLLRNLETLDSCLQKYEGIDRNISHALIGKYVYLSYLRDRNILSDRKLGQWGLSYENIFGRNAKRSSFFELCVHLKKWLNVDLFPLRPTDRAAVKAQHLKLVASAFAGDQVHALGHIQMHLDFKPYDFSFLPIETLSVIYEQFLHDGDDPLNNRAKQAGAYYTPLPIVNLMLDELEARHPISTGMRVFDPSCGSGAFLVQCFRRLVEKHVRPVRSRPSLTDLRTLLEKHIFGVDLDNDACSVTELSLTLTLLDYLEPPDLTDRPRARLPVLRNKNIFCSNFFESNSPWHSLLTRHKCAWIVGNPPWKSINAPQRAPIERAPLAWIQANQAEKPVGDYQLARAFAWRATDYVAEDGMVAFLLPALSLFAERARDFRSAFFNSLDVEVIVNLANLRRILFKGRSKAPAAAFFYRLPGTNTREYVSIYSPVLANQELIRPLKSDREAWAFVVNASEIKDVALSELEDGNPLPWKIASWGSYLDQRILRKTERKWPSLGKLESLGLYQISEGLQLRRETSREPVEYVPEVMGKNFLDLKRLKGRRKRFALPPWSVYTNSAELSYVRKGRASRALVVCRPPHILVSAARTFAIYSEDYVIVPPRQVGITSPSNDRPLLKALTLYMNSDFAFYFQFFRSSELGTERDRSTLGVLRSLPIALPEPGSSEMQTWVDLHSELVSSSIELDGTRGPQLDPNASSKHDALIMALNKKIYEALELDEREQQIISDFVSVRSGLNDGGLAERSISVPDQERMLAYGQRLKNELDDFVSEISSKRHTVHIVFDRQSAFVEVRYAKNAARGCDVLVQDADASGHQVLGNARDIVRKRYNQWIYFDRNLRIYLGKEVYILKPMQTVHWTQTQAMLDASQIISETISNQEGDFDPGEVRKLNGFL